MNRRGIILLAVFSALCILAAGRASHPPEYRRYIAPAAMTLGFGLLAAAVAGRLGREKARKEAALSEVRARENHLEQVNAQLHAGWRELSERGARLRELNTRLEENERRIRESECRMQGILTSLNDTMVFALDRDGIHQALWRDIRLDRKYGMDLSGLVGRSLKDVFPGEAAKRLEDGVRQAIEKGESVVVEQALQAPGGTFWQEFSIVPLRGTMDNAVCVVRDITERKDAERRLEDERRLFMDGPVIVFRWKAAEGWPVEYVSPNVRERLGYDRDDFVSGRIHYSQLLPPSDKDRVTRQLEENVASGASLFQMEYRVRSADGRLLWMFDHTRIIRDEQGRVAYLHGYIEDCTERKKSERTLRMTQFAVDRGADALFWVDEEGSLLYVNETACSMLRKTREALLAMKIFDLLPGQTPDRWMRTWKQVRLSGSVRLEVKDMSDGTVVFPAEILCNYLSYDEQEFNCIVIRDVSEESRSRKALADSELRYRRLVESVTDYIYTVTVRDGKAVSTSHGPGCVAVTGYESADYQRDGFLWVNMVPGDDRPAVLEQAAKLLSGEAARPLEHRIVHKDGGIRWVKNTPVPRYDDGGVLIGYDGLISNITERRLAEEALLEYARKLEILNRIIVSAGRAHDLNALMDDVLERILEMMAFDCGGIYMLDESGRKAGLVAAKTLGDQGLLAAFSEHGREMPLSSQPGNRVLLEGQGYFADNFSEVEPEFVRQTGLVSIAAAPIRFKDRTIGAVKIGALTRHRLTQSEKDRLLSVCLQVGIVMDKVRSEAALRESEEKYRTLTEQVLTGIFILKSGRVLFANEGFSKMVGYSLAEILSWDYEKFLELVHPDDRPFALAQLKKRLGGVQDTATFDWRFISKSGEVRWMFLTTKVAPYGGGPAIIGVFMDITDRKLAEQALETANRRLRAREEEMRALNLHLMAANREKEVLMKEVHHRVKNNLQVISSLLKLQSGAVQDSRIVGLLRECQSRIKTMALVHEKIYQSRNLSEVDMGEYLRSLGDHLFNMFGVKTDRIRLKVAADQVTLSLDKAIPCSLLVNELISNSLKYAFPDGRSGEISVSLQGLAPNRMRVEVRDNGVGFPGDLDFRNTSSLGMQLVMTFVEQLGGDIEKAPGPGTSFVLKF